LPTIGVLAYQGDFQKHLTTLERIGAEAVPVRTPGQLECCDALIVPGGESTTIGMLSQRFGMVTALRERMGGGFPVFGTCAGAILLADSLVASEQPRFGGLPVVVERNAYGRQIDSFESRLEATVEGISCGLAEPPVLGVFIRAPIITDSGTTEVLLTCEDRPVLVRHGALLAATFHPELTDDPRIHRLFLAMVGH
jgi:5'-phosphate synthase pdxT subunit